MKKVLFLFVFAILVSVNTYSQNIKEGIPKFAENLLAMSKDSSSKHLVNRGFKVLSEKEKLSLGYDKISAAMTIVSMGDDGIICKVLTSKDGTKSEQVHVTSKYPKMKNVDSEYLSSGYRLDMDNSTMDEFVYMKQNNEYVYAAFINYVITPKECIVSAEFRRGKKK